MPGNAFYFGHLFSPTSFPFLHRPFGTLSAFAWYHFHFVTFFNFAKVILKHQNIQQNISKGLHD